MNAPRRITGAQAKMLRAVIDYISREGISPSIRDLGAALELSSSSTVWHTLQELAKRGYVSMQRNKQRSIRVLRDLDGCPVQSEMTRQEVSLVQA